MSWHAKYGNCFTFNTKFNEQDELGGERTTALTGPSYGLFLTLDLEQKHYMQDGATKQVAIDYTPISVKNMFLCLTKIFVLIVINMLTGRSKTNHPRYADQTICG